MCAKFVLKSMRADPDQDERAVQNIFAINANYTRANAVQEIKEAVLDATGTPDPGVTDMMQQCKRWMSKQKADFQRACVACLERLTNLLVCWDKNWRSFVVDDFNRDDCMQCIVNNDGLGFLSNSSKALRLAEQRVSSALEALTCERLDKQLAERIDAAISDAKLMLGVRAILTCVLVRIPSCATARSRAAVVREAKALVGKLKVTFPASLLARLDSAS